jgi:hypothetical protein
MESSGLLELPRERWSSLTPSGVRWILVFLLALASGLCAVDLLVTLVFGPFSWTPAWLSTGADGPAIASLGGITLSIASVFLFSTYSLRATKPLNLLVLKARYPDSMVCISYAAYSELKYIRDHLPAGIQKTPRIKSNNYLVFSPTSLSIWQEGRRSLIRVGEIERGSVVGVEPTRVTALGTVSFGFLLRLESSPNQPRPAIEFVANGGKLLVSRSYRTDFANYVSNWIFCARPVVDT